MKNLRHRYIFNFNNQKYWNGYNWTIKFLAMKFEDKEKAQQEDAGNYTALNDGDWNQREDLDCEAPTLGEWQYGKVKVRDWNCEDLIACGLNDTLDDHYDPSINGNQPIESRYREGEKDDMIQIKVNDNWLYTQNIDWE